MKSILFAIMTFFFISSARSQGGNQLIQELSQGHYKKVSRHFAPKLEICYGDEVYFLPKAKAASKFEKILKGLHPTSIKALHKGVSDNRASKYIIGEIKSSKGNHRIFIFAKKRDGRLVIQEVRIEPF